jgi:tetratricopeptide (TPR) repeat protein
MTYLGNPTLPADVQQRIRSTFEHTLGLAEKGSRQEAMLGCDFVLRMDPQFEPARRLQERLDSTAGPLAVEDLRRLESSVAPSAGGAHSLWADLDGLASELPDLPEPPGGGLQGAGSPAEIRAEFESLLAERRFQELQNHAEQQRTAVTGDLELQRIVALGQERLEAAPYVSKFLHSARDALRAGNTAESGRLVEKARALDPTHPGIAELALPGGGYSDGGAAAPGRLAPHLTISGSGAGQPAGTLYSPPERPALPVSALPPVSPPSAPARGTAPAQHGAPPGAAYAGGPAPGFPYSSSGGGDSESELRIQQLLDAGQAALDGGDPQAAIDAWSRIFLIDIDHQEAARRIEEARRLKAERDRQVEETLHDGLAALEGRDVMAARGAFQHVLELQPGHLKAREALHQIDEGGGWPAGGSAAAAAGATSRMAAPGSPGGAAPGGSGLSGSLGALAAHDSGTPAAMGLEADLQEEILVPPDIDKGAGRAGEPRREERSASVGAHEGRARRLFVVVGGCVLFLILVVGWFLYQKRETWFPNSRTEEPAQPPAPNPIPRATKLHDSGKVATALTQLRRVAPGDPHFKDAQALIAKWQEEQAQSAGAAEPAALGTVSSAAGAGGQAPTAALSPEAAHRATLLDQAHIAFQESMFLLAAERFGAADKLAKLDAVDAGQFAAAKQHLVAIQREVAMFAGHDWEYALPILWTDHQTDPGNKDVTRMIVDSYYDLGVRDLQHGDARKAAEKFTEAQHVAPDDPDVMRQLVFAQTYEGRDIDLLYRIYVKYLPLR